jgi:hypothetical protein
MAKNETNLDESLIDGLALAKKRTVHYLMAIKGSEVVGLIIQKKKIKQKQALETKKESKATLLVEGVCAASGSNLTFEVLESPPDIKNSKIKEFVSERTESTIKPDWVVVRQFTEVPSEPGDEDPEETREDDSSDRNSELTAQLTAITPDIKLALANHPSVKGDFLQLIQTFKSQLSADPPGSQLLAAAQTLETIRQRLASLTTTNSEGSTTNGRTREAAASDLMAQMNLLSPQVKNALSLHPHRKEEFVQLIQSFKTQHASVIAGQPVDEANQTLNAIRVLLDALSSSTSDTGDSASADGSSDSEQVESEADDTVSLNADEEYLATQVERDSPFFSLWPEAKRVWRDAMEDVDAQMARLQQKLLDSEDDDVMEIGEFGLNAVTSNHKVPIMAGMLEVDQAGELLAFGTVMKLVQKIIKFRQFLQQDIRVAACDENPFGVPVSIRGTLIPALEQLELSLTEALP